MHNCQRTSYQLSCPWAMGSNLHNAYWPAIFQVGWYKIEPHRRIRLWLTLNHPHTAHKMHKTSLEQRQTAGNSVHYKFRLWFSRYWWDEHVTCQLYLYVEPSAEEIWINSNTPAWYLELFDTPAMKGSTFCWNGNSQGKSMRLDSSIPWYCHFIDEGFHFWIIKNARIPVAFTRVFAQSKF